MNANNKSMAQNELRNFFHVRISLWPYAVAGEKITTGAGGKKHDKGKK